MESFRRNGGGLLRNSKRSFLTSFTEDRLGKILAKTNSAHGAGSFKTEDSGAPFRRRVSLQEGGFGERLGASVPPSYRFLVAISDVCDDSWATWLRRQKRFSLDPAEREYGDPGARFTSAAAQIPRSAVS